jgi:ubiquitin conjugation factor E4 B
VSKIKAQQNSPAWAELNPRVRQSHDMQIKAFEKQLDDMIGQKLALKTGVACPATIEHLMRFYNLVMVWLIKSVAGNAQKVDYSRVARGDISGLNLFPLSADVPMQFATLPEWIIEDICDFYLYILKYYRLT